MTKYKWIRSLWIGLGILSLIVGTIGIVLPLLPTVPFYLLTVFAFSKGSPQLHKWFVNTKLYKKHLANFAKGQGMTIRAKLGIIVPVTIIMGLGFYLAANHFVRMILATVWAAHLYVFFFRIKTINHTCK